MREGRSEIGPVDVCVERKGDVKREKERGKGGMDGSRWSYGVGSDCNGRYRGTWDSTASRCSASARPLCPSSWQLRSYDAVVGVTGKTYRKHGLALTEVSRAFPEVFAAEFLTLMFHM